MYKGHRLFFLIVTFLAVWLIASLPCREIYAEETGGSGDSQGVKSNSEHKNTTGGFSKNRTGYLVYAYESGDGGGSVASAVWLVPYSSKPTGVENAVKTRLGGEAIDSCYSGNIAAATNGAFNEPPCTVDDDAFGKEMKSSLLAEDSDGKAKVIGFIKNVLGEQCASDFVENENMFLIIEPVFWSGTKSSDDTDLVMYTPYTMADSLAGEISPSFMPRHFHRRIPLSGYIEHDWIEGLVPPENIPTGNITYDDIKNYGYGIIMFNHKRDGESVDKDDDEEDSVQTSDKLKASELNYIFPDFLPKSREKDAYGDENKISTPSWNKYTGDGYTGSALKDGSWSVKETKTLLDNELLYYRPGAGKYAKDTESKSFPSEVTEVYPGYAYNYSRVNFGDNLVVCSYRGNGHSYGDYLKSLGYQLGHGRSTTENISVGSGKEKTLGEESIKTSSYTFYGEAVEQYKKWELVGSHTEEKIVGDKTETITVPDYGWVDKTESYSTDPITYDLTHTIIKYVPLELGKSQNPSAGSVIFKSTNANNGSCTGMAFSTNIADKDVSIIPEVKYSMQILNGEEGVWGLNDEVETVDVYCMGEKIRKADPSTLRGYALSASVLKGASIVESPLVGTKAINFAENAVRKNSDGSNLEVCAKGSGYEVVTTTNPVIKCTSFTLDLYDGNVGRGFKPSEEWENPATLDSHKDFVGKLKNGIRTEVHMKKSSASNNGSNSGFLPIETYDISETIEEDVQTEQIRILLGDNGAISEESRDSILGKINEAFNLNDLGRAEEIYREWGIESQVADMLETSETTGNGSSGKWYNEETQCLAVTIHQTKLKIGSIIFDDKVGYGSDGQGVSMANGSVYDFYLTIGFSSGESLTEGFTLNIDGEDFVYDNEANILMKNRLIEDASFLVSNTVTNDWIR